MEITIRAVDEQNVGDVEKIDGAFVVDARVVISVEDGAIRWTTVAVAPHHKRYPVEEIDYSAYISSADRAIFLAYADGEVAGQVRLRRNWNGYAYVEDIAVDARFRRLGVGRALIEQAARWAREQELAGVMLETQDTNAAVCRFYERCGFVLGGFDRLLYRGLDRETDEVALFWYRVFDASEA